MEKAYESVEAISIAGKRVGLSGKRSGLWAEFARLIGEFRPTFVIVEDTSGLLYGERGAWFGRILGDLATLGNDAEWHCIPASAVSAEHEWDRVWVIATLTVCGNYNYKGASRSSGDSLATVLRRMMPTLTRHHYRGGCKSERTQKMWLTSKRGCDLPSKRGAGKI